MKTFQQYWKEYMHRLCFEWNGITDDVASAIRVLLVCGAGVVIRLLLICVLPLSAAVIAYFEQKADIKREAYWKKQRDEHSDIW